MASPQLGISACTSFHQQVVLLYRYTVGAHPELDASNLESTEYSVTQYLPTEEKE
jgi:hypothetical protein